MLPLYATRIEDLGPGEFVKIDCAACHRVALLTPEALLRLGPSPAAKVLDLKDRLRCHGCGRKGRAVVSIKWWGRARKGCVATEGDVCQKCADPIQIGATGEEDCQGEQDNPGQQSARPDRRRNARRQPARGTG